LDEIRTDKDTSKKKKQSLAWQKENEREREKNNIRAKLNKLKELYVNKKTTFSFFLIFN
jgi:hypothetical protein